MTTFNLVLHMWLILNAGWSQTMETALLKTVLHATDMTIVESQLGRYQEAKESEHACRWQVREKMIPSECYRLIAMNRSIQAKPPQHWKKLITALDQLCLKFSNLSSTQGDITIPTENGYLSPICKNELKKLIAFKKYQLQTNDWSKN